MCQVKVSCSGGGSGGCALLLAAGVVVCVVGSAAMSLLSAVVAALTTLVWALAAVGGLGVLAVAGVWALREVLTYRADRRDDEQVRLLLAARDVSLQSLAPMPARPAMNPASRVLLPTGRGGAW